MRTVNIHEAKTHLSRLIRSVEAGDDIVIARAGRPLVRLVLVEEAQSSRELGTAKGQLTIRDDFDAPLDDFGDYS